MLQIVNMDSNFENTIANLQGNQVIIFSTIRILVSDIFLVVGIKHYMLIKMIGNNFMAYENKKRMQLSL